MNFGKKKFENHPAGRYVVTVEKAIYKNDKNNNKMINFTYSTDHPDGNKKVFESVCFGKDGTGYAKQEGEDVNPVVQNFFDSYEHVWGTAIETVEVTNPKKNQIEQLITKWDGKKFDAEISYTDNGFCVVGKQVKSQQPERNTINEEDIPF